ncbi:SRPBCC family protein [Georgenia sp. AZ-5]|uniref:SRPBCC family protein n=1 Tax=Georgenia sp. AZ-5 TaxID=3367526 RepID=UPI0037551A9B
MSRVYVSAILDHPVDAVWDVVGDFHGLPRWVERIQDSIVEGDSGRGAVGSIRRVVIGPERRTMGERLLSYDAQRRRYSYEVSDGPMPYRMTSYRGTVRVAPVTETAQTFLEWYGDYGCAAEDVEFVEQTMSAIFRGFIVDLRKHLASVSSPV